MDTFGEKLRSVREGRGLTLESAAAATGIEIHHLRALEANEFDALPGEDFILGCLRGYATHLSVDADLMIADYRYGRKGNAPAAPRSEPGRAPRATPQAAPTTTPAAPSAHHAVIAAVASASPTGRSAGPDPATERPSTAGVRSAPAPAASGGGAKAGSLPRPESAVPAILAAQAWRLPLWPAAPLLLGVAVITAWWYGSSAPVDREPRTFEPTETAEAKDDGPRADAPAVALRDAAVTPPVDSGARRAIAPVDVTDTAGEPVPGRPAVTSADAQLPSISEHGVGTAVKNRKLVGERSRFREGSQAWFWTHVQGGEPGDRVHHVWIHDGVEVANVKLRIGSPSWRTQSFKTLQPGSTGEWVVEARDGAGRLLARDEFVCVP